MRPVATFDNPPIPDRRWDWSAVDADTYGGDAGEPVGYGRTEQEAIADLLRQIAELEEESE